jgi:hypothetical protein
MNRLIPLAQISPILDKSAGSSIAGVKSILKSPVCTNLAPAGDSKYTHAQSGIE